MLFSLTELLKLLTIISKDIKFLLIGAVFQSKCRRQEVSQVADCYDYIMCVVRDVSAMDTPPDGVRLATLIGARYEGDARPASTAVYGHTDMKREDLEYSSRCGV